MKPGLRRLAQGSVAIFIALLLGELSVRGLVQVPLYGADKEVGYFLKPNQSGSFLQNEWVFNSSSMGVAEEYRLGQNLDVLLIGDSIVYGGNELDQPDKLGPLIEAKTGWQVWPVSAGSWSLQNELAFVERSGLLRPNLDVVVFVLNKGDFGLPSSWESNLTHPLQFPNSRLHYFFQRYVTKRDDSGLKMIRVDAKNLTDSWLDFDASLRRLGAKTVVVGYPGKIPADQNCNWIPKFVRDSATVYCFPSASQFNEVGFRDDFHPNKTGNERLAKATIGAVQNALSTPSAQ